MADIQVVRGKSRDEAVQNMVRAAQALRERTPNNPHVEQTGENEVSVMIGIVKVKSFCAEWP